MRRSRADEPRWNSSIVFQGHPWRPDEKPYLDFNGVSPRYFETLGIPILEGRDFRDQDNPPFTPDPLEKPLPEGKEPPVRIEGSSCSTAASPARIAVLAVTAPAVAAVAALVANAEVRAANRQ